MSAPRPVYAFGAFRLDLQERLLFRDAAPVAITAKALAILTILVERRGRIVDKADLMQEVWPDTNVEEGNLTQNIHLLRKTLGPPSECAIVIETVPRRGYRLTGSVTVVSAGASPDAIAGSTVEVTPRRWVALAMATLLGTGVAGGWYLAAGGSDARSPVVSGGAPPASRGLRPLNSLPGDKSGPTLSPDGDRLAFVWDRGRGHNVYVAQVGTDSVLQVTDGPGGTETPAWSPDGRSLAYVRKFLDSEGVGRRGVFIVSATGGTSRAVWVRPSADYAGFAAMGLDWSADGSFLVFSAPPSALAPPQVVLLSTVDGTERSPVSPPPPGEHDEYPVFSPDGTTVAFVRHGSESRIVTQDIAGGAARVLPVRGHAIRRLAWTADGSSLVFESEQTRRLWTVSLRTGEVATVPDLGEGSREPSIARRTGHLAYLQLRRDVNLVRSGIRTGVAPRSIQPLASTTLTDRHGSISADGSRIAFVSDRSGTGEIWLMHGDGGAPRQLTDLGTSAVHPRWSADGRSIVFAANPPASRSRSIFVVDVESGVTRRLTSDPSIDRWPTWSHDGTAVYYTSNRTGEWAVWRILSSGGEPERVAGAPGMKAVESPDGTYLYYASAAPVTIWRRPVAGGSAAPVVALAPTSAWGGEWQVTERGIYWVDERQTPSVLAFHDFRTNRTSATLTLPATYEDGGGFSVSPDGSWVVFGQRDYDASDLLLVDGFTSGRTVQARR